jgi:hypothetical protein
MGDRDNRIREIAYLIWESEGRPLDQAERHWKMAESWVEEEEAERKEGEGEPPGEETSEDPEKPQ